MISVVPTWGCIIFLLGMVGVGIYTLIAIIVEMFRNR